MNKQYKNIVILTGAGISAESGLATFRSSNGLWNNHRVEDVASVEGFRRNPALVHDFYNDLKRDYPPAKRISGRNFRRYPKCRHAPRKSRQ